MWKEKYINREEIGVLEEDDVGFVAVVKDWYSGLYDCDDEEGLFELMLRWKFTPFDDSLDLVSVEIADCTPVRLTIGDSYLILGGIGWYDESDKLGFLEAAKCLRNSVGFANTRWMLNKKKLWNQLKEI